MDKHQLTDFSNDIRNAVVQRYGNQPRIPLGSGLLSFMRVEISKNLGAMGYDRSDRMQVRGEVADWLRKKHRTGKDLPLDILVDGVVRIAYNTLVKTGGTPAAAHQGSSNPNTRKPSPSRVATKVDNALKHAFCFDPTLGELVWNSPADVVACVGTVDTKLCNLGFSPQDAQLYSSALHRLAGGVPLPCRLPIAMWIGHLYDRLDDEALGRVWDMQKAFTQFTSDVIQRNPAAAVPNGSPAIPTQSHGTFSTQYHQPPGVQPFDDKPRNDSRITDDTIKAITELAQEADCKEACEFYQTVSHKNIQKILKLLQGA